MPKQTVNPKDLSNEELEYVIKTGKLPNKYTDSTPASTLAPSFSPRNNGATAKISTSLNDNISSQYDSSLPAATYSRLGHSALRNSPPRSSAVESKTYSIRNESTGRSLSPAERPSLM